jgi:UPF0755 protein
MRIRICATTPRICRRRDHAPDRCAGSGRRGPFFPDTYSLPSAAAMSSCWRAPTVRCSSICSAPGRRGRTELPYRDPYQALIMASIVEKETGRADDRPLVAGVFVNRLRQGMLLQTDPTVIYGIRRGLRRRSAQARPARRHAVQHLYPAGLPPTPIAMPGLASLQAALHPAATEALYFVARGDGSSQFSPTLDEHNRAVRRFQKGGRP